MADQVIDLDRPFTEVFRALDLTIQRKALRGAMRREGNRLRKTATSNLSQSGIGGGTKRSLSSGIYVRVYPDNYGAGFMVSVRPRGKNKGIHLNRQDLQKPVLMWAEDGTRQRRIGRRVSSSLSKSRFTGKKVRQYLRGGANRGKMKRYGFLAKTEEQTAASVEANLFNNFQGNLEKAARRQGLL